ncbi:hypothetical protein [Streptomyces pactum]|uniref:Lipoprotein n=1 Tax=Streptomyces pactum TaxID=68249 RepID=A0A1S6JBP1_9ACTN|nr:hypothetical protein [Streptomyces pactum]AQS69185.1 hypothetical protein B1H29_21780 [Streptomyces pactum]
MIRPARLVTAVLTASAALLLTACGSGGGGGSSSDDIKGADTGSGEASADASPTASARVIERPEITLPPTFSMNFESWTNGDPKLQAILDDGRETLRASHAAVIAADPDADYVAFYNEGPALESARTWINGFVKTDDSLIGEVDVFDSQVRINSQGLGVLFYCVNEGKASTKNRKTDKVVGTPADVSPYLQYRTTLQKTSQGLWKTRSVETERGACGK